MGRLLLISQNEIEDTREEYDERIRPKVNYHESRFEAYAQRKLLPIDRKIIDYARARFAAGSSERLIKKAAQFAGDLFVPRDFDFDLSPLLPVIGVGIDFQKQRLLDQMREEKINANDVRGAFGVSFDKDVGSKYIDLLRDRQGFLAQVLEETTLRQTNKIIEDGINAGMSFDQLSKKLSEDIGFSGVRAQRIARTETNWALNEGTRQYIATLGVKEYKISPAPSACPICQSLAASTFGVMSVDILPIHPNCRCTIVSVIPDEWLKAEKIQETKAKAINLKTVAPPTGVNPLASSADFKERFKRTLSASSNQYNKSLEEILRTHKGAELERALQTYVNALPPAGIDPLADTTRKLLQDRYNIKAAPKVTAAITQSPIDVKLARLDAQKVVEKLDLSEKEKEFIVNNNIAIRRRPEPGDGTRALFATPFQGDKIDASITVYDTMKNNLPQTQKDVYHEIGHAIDYLSNKPNVLDPRVIMENIRYRPLSGEPDFIDLYFSEEKDKVIAAKIANTRGVSIDQAERMLAADIKTAESIGKEYKDYLNLKEEVFAEAYAQYRYNPAKLKQYAPGFYKLIDAVWGKL